jgi:hypothetical protein
LVVSPFKKWLSNEHHSSKHAANTPNVKAIVIMPVYNKELRCLEIPGCNTHIIRFMRDVIVCKSPVCYFETFALMVEKDVAWLDVSMDDSF